MVPDWSKPAEKVADARQLQSRRRQSFVRFFVLLAGGVVIFFFAGKSAWLAALGSVCLVLGFGAFLDWTRSRRRLRELGVLRRELEADAKRFSGRDASRPSDAGQDGEREDAGRPE